VQQDLEVKIAKGQFLGVFETDSTSFSDYAKDWLERKIVTVTQSTYRDYRSTMEVYALPHFGDTPWRGCSGTPARKCCIATMGSSSGTGCEGMGRGS